MDIIGDYFEEFWKKETGVEIPADILDTILKNLERDASDLATQELDEGLEDLLKIGKTAKTGKSVKSLQKLLSPAQKAAKFRSLKSAQKALKNFKNLKGARKGSKTFKQLQKNIRAAGKLGPNLGKLGKAGKNLKKGKRYFRGMLDLCKRFPKTCAAAGIVAVGTVYHEEIRDWMEDFLGGGEKADLSSSGWGGSEATPGTARWRREQGLPPVPDTLAAYRAKKAAGKGK